MSVLLAISNPTVPGNFPVVNTNNIYIIDGKTKNLVTKSFSLNERSDNEYVNAVFKDNILLTLNYLDGTVKNKSDIVWDDIEKPRVYQFTLDPGESFAFHEQVLLDIGKNVVKTTNAHFNYQDGFKSDGYLMGDGVCHLASLIYWAAKDANLEAYAPTNHDFARINEVPKEYGVSIYSLPGGFDVSARQNLYITNNLDNTVTFIFSYDGNNLTVGITKSMR